MYEAYSYEDMKDKVQKNKNQFITTHKKLCAQVYLEYIYRQWLEKNVYKNFIKIIHMQNA